LRGLTLTLSFAPNPALRELIPVLLLFFIVVFLHFLIAVPHFFIVVFLLFLIAVFFVTLAPSLVSLGCGA
jgi:hypothetical protein